MDQRSKLIFQWSSGLLPLCILLTTGTFLIDLFTPFGVAGGVPYVAPVLLSAFFPKRKAPFGVGTICSVFTIIGLLYSPGGEMLNSNAWVNRGLALFAIWVTAILSYYQNKFRSQREEALARIRVLEGILPICVDCKKIRDEAGNWYNIESFISQHSEAEFSHGYCPECGKKMLQEIKERFPER